ncbi:MAG: formamidopyrimidine-DNA glycosylase [Rhodothermales bacterium]|jgi:formamidopyrimidine-DNA glycosylase
MPELPDIEAYLHVLRRDVKGRVVRGVRLRSPFLVRTITPPLNSIVEAELSGLQRIGKRVVMEFASFQPVRFVVIHLMKAGRLKWGKSGAGLPGKMGLCAFDFDHGSMLLTEAGNKRRASIHVVEGEEALAELDPGGAEVFDITQQTFQERLRARRHTLKRALTDPHILAGIGAAYSDEIMLRARLSPLKQIHQLSDDDMATLHQACKEVLAEWRDAIKLEAGSGWPKVTAFRTGMGAHGKAGQPCPQCGTPIRRIVYSETETNYCSTCQTGGKVLKDRALSRLLKDDWPTGGQA